MRPLDSAEDLADEIWQVRLPNGAVQAMSIEEVDDAFTRGELDMQTKVQRPSGGDWLSIAEAAGMAGDSITPMAVATEVRSTIPGPPPLPRRPLQSIDDDAPLSADELRSVRPRGGVSSYIGFAGAAALFLGGFVAWHYLPAHPIPSLATTTIMALNPSPRRSPHPRRRPRRRATR